MTIAEQSKAIVAALKDWAVPNKGRAFMAGDPIHLLDELRSKPGSPSAGVLFIEELARGEHPELGRVDRSFKVVISRGRSFKLVPGESLTEGAAGGPPMFDLAEQAREIILAMRADAAAMGDNPWSEDQLPTYKGIRQFEINGMILDAYEVSFTIPAQITFQSPVPATSDETAVMA